MITAKDAEFHDGDPEIPEWAETRFMSFSVPEQELFCNVHVLARPNVGVVISDITVQKGFARHPWEMDVADRRVHRTPVCAQHHGA